ncbi:hypothetical protein SAMN06298216_2724 [Spirosomataceae bacterium TFI 002]|nr:hypothetical protein SAMN06298216_2724 [Spirosomataceae bacterium TFI 002]
MTTRKIIFATALAFLINGVNFTANATTDSTSKYLVSNSSNEFNSFMSSKAKRFVKKNSTDWNTFNKVVNLYNVSTGKFQSMTPAEQAEFLQAAKSINAKLATIKGEEAAQWLKKVNLTSAIYQFVWSSKVMDREIENTIEVPVMVNFDRPIGR